MGPERDPEDSNEGAGQSPKLSLAGRIEGTIDGRPVSLVARGGDLTLSVGNLRTIVTLRRNWPAVIGSLRPLIERGNLRLLVQLRWTGALEVFPNPSLLLRLYPPRTL
jgi:hypothetical protein